MLMSVLLICGVILGVSALASSLVLQQLKKSTAAGESARAIFAADAGIERALWERYHVAEIRNACAVVGGVLPPVSNFEETFSIDDGEHDSWYKAVIVDCDHASSLGESGRSARAFSVHFDGLCELGGQISPSFCETATTTP